MEFLLLPESASGGPGVPLSLFGALGVLKRPRCRPCGEKRAILTPKGVVKGRRWNSRLSTSPCWEDRERRPRRSTIRAWRNASGFDCGARGAVLAPTSRSLRDGVGLLHLPESISGVLGAPLSSIRAQGMEGRRVSDYAMEIATLAPRPEFGRWWWNSCVFQSPLWRGREGSSRPSALGTWESRGFQPSEVRSATHASRAGVWEVITEFLRLPESASRASRVLLSLCSALRA